VPNHNLDAGSKPTGYRMALHRSKGSTIAALLREARRAPKFRSGWIGFTSAMTRCFGSSSDAADAIPNRLTFFVENCIEQLLQHERVTLTAPCRRFANP
jgi:hypothetical protein